MKDLFKIIIGDDFVFSSISGTVVAGIYVETVERSFPDNQWTDFVERVLGTWLYNLVDAKNKANVDFNLFFMDGPFRLDVHKDNQMNLSVSCINARYDEKAEIVFCCTYVEFLQELYRAFNQFKTYLYKKKMGDDIYESAYKQTIISLNTIRDTIKELNPK